MLYKDLADNFNSAMADDDIADTYIKIARDAIVDTTGNANLAVALLGPIEGAYKGVRGFFQSIVYIIIAVRAINNYYTDTEGDLTTYVNSISWDEGSVPSYWKSLSEQAGFDTTDWA